MQSVYYESPVFRIARLSVYGINSRGLEYPNDPQLKFQPLQGREKREKAKEEKARTRESDEGKTRGAHRRNGSVFYARGSARAVRAFARALRRLARCSETRFHRRVIDHAILRQTSTDLHIERFERRTLCSACNLYSLAVFLRLCVSKLILKKEETSRLLNI